MPTVRVRAFLCRWTAMEPDLSRTSTMATEKATHVVLSRA
jgi:hypothetical protein